MKKRREKISVFFFFLQELISFACRSKEFFTYSVHELELGSQNFGLTRERKVGYREKRRGQVKRAKDKRTGTDAVPFSLISSAILFSSYLFLVNLKTLTKEV